jgi:hypothetical protein
MLFVPVRLEVVQVADPLVTGAAAQIVVGVLEPLGVAKKAMVPATPTRGGWVEPAVDGATVAVKVTGWLSTEGFAELVGAGTAVGAAFSRKLALPAPLLVPLA